MPPNLRSTAAARGPTRTNHAVVTDLSVFLHYGLKSMHAQNEGTQWERERSGKGNAISLLQWNAIRNGNGNTMGMGTQSAFWKENAIDLLEREQRSAKVSKVREQLFAIGS